jgi:beta-lactamase class D
VNYYFLVRGQVGKPSTSIQILFFEMNGSLMVGRNNDRKNITINSNSTFRVEGSLIIYGDLILNDGATLEFVGKNSNVHISGKVRKAKTAKVKSNFKD